MTRRLCCECFRFQPFFPVDRRNAWSGVRHLLKAPKIAVAERNIHLLHDGVRRPAPRPGNQIQYRHFLADDHRLNPAIRQITNPPQEAQFLASSVIDQR